MKIEKAVKILTKEIRKDEDLRQSYKANIAMAFIDECNNTNGFYNTSYKRLHEAANKAAERFLNNWCRKQ